jgi:hypothetical protein
MSGEIVLNVLTWLILVNTAVISTLGVIYLGNLIWKAWSR